MNKNYIFSSLILAVLFSANTFAQQLSRRTQFATNTFMVNPAAAGTTNYSPIYASYRNQWTGFKNAPSTILLTGHTPFGKGFAGGVKAYRDDTGGAISRTGVELTGAYSAKLTFDDAVSFGLSMGGNQLVFDNSSLIVYDQNDAALNNFQKEVSMNLTTAFGMLVYGKQYYFGFAINNLAQTKMGLQTSIDPGENLNVRHFQLMGSYRYYLNDVLDLQPSAFMRFSGNTPVQTDVNIRLNYLEKAFGGITLRYKDAIGVMAGGSFKNFALIYSYDFTTGEAKPFSPHTHEVTVGYMIPNKRGLFKANNLGGRVLDRSRVVN